jgi:pantoate--beta-alanine ligase
VRDLDMPLTIVPCEIVREEDGLARSSRNVYLTAEERAAAPVLYQGLRDAKAAFDAGERDPDRLRFIVGQTISRRTLAAIEYISLADSESLEELQSPLGGRPALLSLVVRFGKTRLLDNIELLASED